MTQLTPEQIADGWKPHGGGPCPVGLDTMPGVMFLDGIIVEPGCAYAGSWTDSWRHQGHKRHHIIAYKEQSNG